MSSGIKYKWAVRFVIALAIMPILLGNTFHCLVPGTHGSHSSGGPFSCCSHNAEHESHSLPTTEDSCSICDFLAMPSDVTRPVAWDCVLDLVERREPEPVQAFVVLYRPFEPGRAPPTVV